MTDDLLDRFRELNPVPAPDRFVIPDGTDAPADPLLRSLLERAGATNNRPITARPTGARRAEHNEQNEQKETPMGTISPPRTADRPVGPRGPRRPWRLAVAAGAVAIVAVAGVMTLTSRQAEPEPDQGFVAEPVPQDPEAEAVSLALTYLEARNAYDVEGARQLVSDDFTTTEPPDGFRDVGTMELAFAQHEAYGFHYSEVDCTPRRDTPEQVEVDCEFLWTTELHRIGGHPPTQETFTMHVEDGRIASIVGRRIPADGRLWWDPFVRFLDLEHAEFRRVVERALALDPDAVRELTEELPGYLERYSRYIEERGEAD